MHNGLVSIIIPTFNRANMLEQTLLSVSEQHYQHWECIVVDDGSDDNTKTFVQALSTEDSRFIYARRPEAKSKGANSCRNYGMEISKGQWIQWFDDDDLLLPDFLTERMQLASKSGIQLVYSGGMIIDQQLNDVREFRVFQTDTLYKDYLMNNLELITGSVMVKRSLLENIDLFDPAIVRGQETEFFSRLFYQLQSQDYSCSQKSLFRYRQHQGSKSSANQTYRTDFKRSQYRITIANFRRAEELRDDELLNHHYQGLLFLFTEALNHGDRPLAKLNYRALWKAIRRYARSRALLSLAHITVMMLASRTSYKMTTSLKNLKLSFR